MSAARTREELIGRPPGHARVIGAPGSGKTTLMVERWRSLTSLGHRPGIVAFGREARERLLERIIAPGVAHLGAHPVTTHALVAAAVLDAARPQRARTLRDVDELLVLARLLRREPTLLASDLFSIANSATFLRTLLETTHALAQHGIASQDARASARNSNNPRARDVLAVYARHREVCEEKGLVSFYDAAWRSAERFEAGGIVSPLAEFDVVLVDDFHDLDPGQYHLLTRLLPPGGTTKLEVFGDPSGARFTFRGTTDRFFLESFPRDYTPDDIELAAPACDDGALRGTVDALIATTSRYTTVPAASDLPLFATSRGHAVHPVRQAWSCTASLVIADDEIAEAQAIAARVRAAIDAGVSPRDIAVVTRDATRYRASLQIACHEWGVPLEGGARGGGAAEDFLRSLIGALGSDKDGRFAESLALSSLSAFRGAHDDIDSALRALKATYSSRGGFDMERLVRERVSPIFAADDAVSGAALVAVVDEWQRYNEVVLHAGGGASLDEFRASYLMERDTHPASGDRVALLSAREAAGRSFRVVFVCGCAEGFFPGVPSRDGYIPLLALSRAVEPANADAARDIAVCLDEPSVERTENALFLTALTRASDSVTMTVPARIGGESTMPARVLVEGAHAFTATHAARAESPCARAARAVAHARSDQALARRLRALDPLAGWWVAPAPAERRPELKSFSMSASKLNSFARCERQFFFRNVLKLDEPESIYLRVGALVHDALKEIIPPGATRDEVRAALQHAGTREIAERLVAAAMNDAGAWMRELSVTYLERMLVSVAELEAQREGEYRVRLLEEPVEAVVEGMPIRGRLDRVDEVEGVGPVVIDYKISGSIDKSYKTLVNKMETSYWQIPVYAVMATLMGLPPAGFVYYALPPGEESHASGVQISGGRMVAPISLGPSKAHQRFGPASPETVADAMTHAIEIHRSITDGDCRYERTSNVGICPNCHYARICQRSRASI